LQERETWLEPTSTVESSKWVLVFRESLPWYKLCPQFWNNKARQTSDRVYVSKATHNFYKPQAKFSIGPGEAWNCRKYIFSFEWS